MIPSKHLIVALSHCRLLLHTHLSHVKLVDDEDAWPDVFRALGSLAQLHQLSLSLLRDHSLCIGRLVFSGLTHGTARHDGRVIEYEGETHIVAGLNELKKTHLPKADDDDDPNPCILFSRETNCHICLQGPDRIAIT